MNEFLGETRGWSWQRCGPDLPDVTLLNKVPILRPDVGAAAFRAHLDRGRGRGPRHARVAVEGKVVARKLLVVPGQAPAGEQGRETPAAALVVVDSVDDPGDLQPFLRAVARRGRCRGPTPGQPGKQYGRQRDYHPAPPTLWHRSTSWDPRDGRRRRSGAFPRTATDLASLRSGSRQTSAAPAAGSLATSATPTRNAR